MPIKIVRSDAGNCITFEGTSNPVYWNSCLSGEVAADDSQLVNVVNDIRSDDNDTFYEFFHIPYTEFRDANNNTFADASAVASYITLNGNVASGTDVSVGYKGGWDASTNTPDLTDSAYSASNGDWYYVVTEGNIDPNTGVDDSQSQSTYRVNDIIKYTAETDNWTLIPNETVRVDQLDDEVNDLLALGVAEYDIYVNPTNNGSGRNGTAVNPYNTLTEAINASSDGDTILIEGDVVVTSAVSMPSDRSLHFYGAENSSVGYSSFGTSNGNVFEQTSTGSSSSFSFRNLTIKNAGGYGVYIRSAQEVIIESCEFKNNGWDGTGLDPLNEEDSSTLGYDSPQSDLQAFYAGSSVSDGGATDIRSTTGVDIKYSTFKNNLRGIRVQDCGVGGHGEVNHNHCFYNLGSGIILQSGSGDSTNGCENFNIFSNINKCNCGNGIEIVGGASNMVALDKIEYNWNSAILLSHVTDTRARDVDLDNNNRSEFNGIGNAGSSASIEIGGNTIRSGHTYLAEILDSTIHNTGSGSSAIRNGLLILSDVATSGKPLINIDDVAFVNQDYAVACDADADNIRLTISDCRYTGTTNANVNISSGKFYELPFSNLHVDASSLNFTVDDTGSVIKVEENSNVIQSYEINALQAVANGSSIRIVAKGSNRIQFDNIPVSGCSISGTNVNSVLSQALVQLNDLFTLASEFNTGSPVTNFTLTGDDLTISLQDGTSYTVDVTTLGVDENKFVSSGALNGSNLELTMNDSTVVTIDASNMINGSQLPAKAEDWYIAYGSSSGDVVTSADVDSTIKDKQPFYNGDFLEKGEEYIWTHDPTGDYMLGVWSGAESVVNYANRFDSSNWSAAFRFVKSSNRISGTGSVGVDTNTRLSTGDNANVTADGQYDVTSSNVLVLRYGQDNHLYLLDVSDGGEFIIGKTNAAIVGDDVTIFFTGGNQPNAKFPVMVKRFEQWTIVHDFDNSENGEWNDGVEADTIIKSNMTISPGEKMLLNFNYFGRNERLGIGYTGASSGVNDAGDDITSYLIYGSAETLKAGDTNNATGGEWTWNQNATAYYNPNGDNSNVGYWNGNGNNLGHISFVYNTDNSIVLYHEGNGEEMATKTVNADGSDINIYIGFSEAHPVQRIPAISKQELTAGSQPITSFAPDISNQSFNVDEGVAFNIQIALDTGSDIVNQYGELDAPSWAVLNQSTGVFNGTAPAYNGSSDSYVIQCKAANALGGSTSFNVTINVQEVTYTNTKSLFFGDGDQSYLGGNAALITSMERAANGTGSSDAWSLSLWYNGSTATTAQTIFYFGGNDTANDGHIELRQTNDNGQKRLRLRYGSGSNYLQFTTPSGSITPGTWQHILVTYDGGTTGVSSGSLTGYYSRFKTYIDGTLQSTSNTHSNYGYSGSIVGENYRVGRYASGQYMKDTKVNQIAIWGSDQQANISDIYNSGATMDLSTLTTAPDHYYEIETSTSSIQDLSGTAHFVGYNFTSSDLVNDAP